MNDGDIYILNIDSEGNIVFNCALGNDRSGEGWWHYNFVGKLADTFEYPYTIELTFIASSLSSTSCHMRKSEFYNGKINELQIKSKIGKFTFSDASTLTALVPYLIFDTRNGGGVYWYNYYGKDVRTLNFTKQ